MNPDAIDVLCIEDALQVTLSDGRIFSVPLAWSPQLYSATPAQRKNGRLLPGIGIRWEEIDEDISVRSLLRLN